MKDHFSNYLGFEVLVAEGDRANVRGVVCPEHTNIADTAHGGFVYALADAAFALAVNSNGKQGPAVATHMEYFRPAHEGETITAEAVDVNVGKHLATYKVDVRRDADGKLIASLTGTAYLTGEALMSKSNG